MSFRFPREAKAWFGGILGRTGTGQRLSTDFDAYYLCLIVGLASKTKRSRPSAEMYDVVDYFVSDYSQRAYLIVALFLHRELEGAGIDFSDRRSVHKKVAALVSPNTNTHLSEEGLAEMNRYVVGGFEVLSERMAQRPKALEEFLLGYHALLQELYRPV